jgi:hypothetical protein
VKEKLKGIGFLGASTRADPIILGASSEISNWAFDHSILN